jgi:hypothetical protein
MVGPLNASGQTLVREDPELYLRVKSVVRVTVSLESGKPVRDKQIQWNILQNLESRLEKTPPVATLKFEQKLRAEQV